MNEEIRKKVKPKYLKKKDFDKYIEKEDYKGFHDKLVVSVWNLAYDIAMARWESNHKNGEPDHIMQGLFRSSENDLGFYKLFYHLTKWYDGIEIPDYYEDGDSEYLYSYKDIGKYIIDEFNEVLDNLAVYYYRSNELYKLKDTTIISREKKKVKNLFKKMLDAIDEKYDDKWTMEKWFEVMKLRYMYFSDYFRQIETILSNYKKMDIIIAVLKIDNICEELEDGYKRDIEFYKKYKISEGETYDAIYDERYEALRQLCKQMLEYIGVEPEDERWDTIRIQVIENFPYYIDNLTHLRVIGHLVAYSMKDVIQCIDAVYEYFEATYRNHEENMKEYEKEQSIEYDANIEDYLG